MTYLEWNDVWEAWYSKYVSIRPNYREKTVEYFSSPSILWRFWIVQSIVFSLLYSYDMYIIGHAYRFSWPSFTMDMSLGFMAHMVLSFLSLLYLSLIAAIVESRSISLELPWNWKEPFQWKKIRMSAILASSQAITWGNIYLIFLSFSSWYGNPETSHYVFFSNALLLYLSGGNLKKIMGAGKRSRTIILTVLPVVMLVIFTLYVLQYGVH